MAASSVQNVLAHWAALHEGLSASTQDYYETLEAAIERRSIPDVKIKRTEFSEGGMFSDNREYLRLVRHRHVVDVCAAPFGKGFFFSWWLSERKPAGWQVFLAFLFLLILAGIAFSLMASMFSGQLMELMFLTPVSAFAALMVSAVASRLGWHALEDAVREIPLIGYLHDRLVAIPTYYRLDTAHMFQSAVHGSVLEAIDGLTGARGLRALTDEERKPILRTLT